MAQDLFEDFSKPSHQDWLNRIQKDLKGKDLETLISETPEGIRVQPIYSPDNSEFPKQPFRKEAGWNIVQEILVTDSKAANTQALDHLSRGADSLLFYLSPGADLEVLLKDVLIEHIKVHFVTAGNGVDVARKLNEIITTRQLDPKSIRGSINVDALENLARTGNWFKSEKEDIQELKKLGELVPPDFRYLCINANLFGNAGATLDQQLGITLAMTYEYIHLLSLTRADQFWINLSIGSDYFGEIAKLRAMRRIWQQLLKELQLPDSPAHIYAESSMRNKTIRDAYNNMIRTSSEAMAAGIGGCDEFSARGFDQTFREPSSFGERIAKNQQNILQHESHLDKVRDISQGSYFIEELTEALGSKGWEFFKRIESEGGYLKALKSGWLQKQVEEKALQEQEAFDNRSRILIGANKYRNEDENLKEIIEYGHFYKLPTDETIVPPVVVKRLSEELEKDQ